MGVCKVECAIVHTLMLMTGVLRRELERQQTLLDVKKCQEYQMEEKRVKRAHDRKISECYKYQAIGMADDARDKAAMEARDKTELVQGWGKQYLAEMEDKKARQHVQTTFTGAGMP